MGSNPTLSAKLARLERKRETRELTLFEGASRVENAFAGAAIAGSRSITSLVNPVRSGRKQR